MTYIDFDVGIAHSSVEGTRVSEDLLGQVSQVFRSMDAANIFQEITGVSIKSRAELIDLFTRVKQRGMNLEKPLQDPRLKEYTTRTGAFHFD